MKRVHNCGTFLASLGSLAIWLLISGFDQWMREPQRKHPGRYDIHIFFELELLKLL